ncbi:MAG: preprotein translocase subunit SecA [Eubacteriales bacterium]|nr:preprotein translocase subunit SecA [Eubacteriales bacterium]
MSFMEKIFGDLNTKELRKIDKIVDQIEGFDKAMEQLSDEELRAKTDEFRSRLESGQDTLDSLLPEAFAAVREGAYRSVHMKPYREQLIGGVVLHQGRIAEMKTGEGKTLVATLPVYLNALTGHGVHVVTVNDYLAKRDSDWMGKVYQFMGLTVGCVVHGLTDEQRRAAYNSDITYGTNNEFGFDYLRDNMVQYQSQLTQRELNFAIVDEVDSILVDEARTPLIISGQGTESTDLYRKADRFVKELTSDDYEVEEKEEQVSLTEEGVAKAEKFFGMENFSDPANMEVNHNIQQALKAHTLMERDVDYIVKDGEIVIVDEFTGRLMPGRRYSNGLHQAIEAKEHLDVRAESKTLATITIQNYFRMYKKLSGMTGTAKTEEDEFREIYNMNVVVIPTHKPVIREDKPDAVYQTERAKFNAVADRVEEVYNHGEGQPVLVGTISIEKSQLVHELLKKRGIPHDVLNAKQHEREAEIIAQAGRKGQVTIATNMAGRGTDILLGGNPDFLARKEMRKKGFSDEEISFATGFAKSDDEKLNHAREEYTKLHDQFKVGTDKEHEEVVKLGGLCIIGTERHESRRIDNQLRGRSGRQGDPGQTQFFLSMEDDLLRKFGGERMQQLVQRAGIPEDEPIEQKMLSRSIENAQKKVEGRNFGIRRYVLQYDDIMNKQREIIYSQRKKVLLEEDLRQYILNMCHDVIEQIVDPITVASKYPEEWDFELMNRNLKRFVDLYQGKEEYSTDELVDMTPESLKQSIFDEFDRMYKKKEEEITPALMRQAERAILLQVVDSHWMDHIDAMDDLREGIGLRAIGQQDPVAAYAKEGFDMFEAMNNEIQMETVQYCYHVTVRTNTERHAVSRIEAETKDEYRDAESSYEETENPYANGPKQRAAGAEGAPQRESKPETYRRAQPKVGRNDPCPCGSGKKYKNCCMKKDMMKARELHMEQEDN